MMKTILAFILLIALVQSKEEINGKITFYSDEKCNKEIELSRNVRTITEGTLVLKEAPLNLQCVKNDVIKSGIVDIDFTNGECLNYEKIKKLLEEIIIGRYKSDIMPITAGQELGQLMAQDMKSLKISWTGACTGLSTGAIIGIVIACLVALIFIGVAAYFCCIKKEEKFFVNQY